MTASAQNSGVGTHSVTAVSQVLGERLDGMLNAAPSSTGAIR
jgi:hypothetical protein